MLCSLLKENILWSKKICEFSFSSEKVFVKHFGQHSCSPVKPRHELEIAESVKKHPAKGVPALKDILCTMFGKLENWENWEWSRPSPWSCYTKQNQYNFKRDNRIQ